jgi:hypothetical protein
VNDDLLFIEASLLIDGAQSEPMPRLIPPALLHSCVFVFIRGSTAFSGSRFHPETHAEWRRMEALAAAQQLRRQKRRLRSPEFRGDPVGRRPPTTEQRLARSGWLVLEQHRNLCYKKDSYGRLRQILP